MAEQLRLIDLQPIEPIDDPYGKTSPQVIWQMPKGMVAYNTKTDFQALSEAHKNAFVPKIKAPVSGYIGRVPDLDLPKPSGRELGRQEREQIIKEKALPEVRPFMAGARIALAKRRANRQHQKAQSTLRHRYVAHNVAKSVLKGEDYSAPENEFRPKTLREKAIAKRIGRLIRRANNHKTFANILEEMFSHTDTFNVFPGEVQTVQKVAFDGDKDKLSIFEKLQRRSARKLHDRRLERSDRVIRGLRIPIVGKRIGLFSFTHLAGGGSDRPTKKVFKALEKRDDAVLKAEALRQLSTKR